MITQKTKEQMRSALQKNGDIETIEALNTILEEIEKNGMSQMVNLDPYFGEISTPLAPQCELLMSDRPEEFAFFDELLKNLTEEIEIFFETTEMYEDEEFEQFEEDIREIKDRYTRLLKEEHMDNMENLALSLLLKA
ncbi:hypothetical protein [Hydrogenimonas sp.]